MVRPTRSVAPMRRAPRRAGWLFDLRARRWRCSWDERFPFVFLDAHKTVLNAHPAAAELYENMRCQHSGLRACLAHRSIACRLRCSPRGYLHGRTADKSDDCFWRPNLPNQRTALDPGCVTRSGPEAVAGRANLIAREQPVKAAGIHSCAASLDAGGAVLAIPSRTAPSTSTAGRRIH